MFIKVMLVSEYEIVDYVHNRLWKYGMCTTSPLPPHYCKQT